MQIKIIELYKNRLVPKPERLALSADEQKVEFVDNLFVYAAYPIRSQETVISVPNIHRIEYYTDKEAVKTDKTKTIKYGPLLGAYKEEELRVHYELAIPLVSFPYVERQIELSHLGSISISEHYELTNDGVKLDGEFSRVRYTSLTSSSQAGHIFRKLHTQLPRRSFGLYYTDVIGNVSTSVAFREVIFLSYGV